VVEIRTLGDASQTDVLAVAASLEHGTTHPLARAILEKASADTVPVREIADFTAVPGAGARGRFAGESALLRVGSVDFLAEEGVAMGAIDRREWAEQGMTIVGVARDRECIGLIALQDRIRSTSASAVRRLRAMGIEVRMLTGDNAATAEAVANQVGITEFRSGVLPAGKAEAVQALRAQGRVTGMVGDGINDAPALAAADVSFAIGTGSDIAIETADITAMRADLNAVVDAVLLSRATLAKIRQNLFFAFAYNVIGIPLAAFGWLSPVVAGAAMAASSVSVVGNALLLRGWSPKDRID
jgi:Cu+-exporting ATPase